MLAFGGWSGRKEGKEEAKRGSASLRERVGRAAGQWWQSVTGRRRKRSELWQRRVNTGWGHQQEAPT